MARKRERDEPKSVFEINEEIASFIQGHVDKKLSEHAIWPANLLKLELETANVFQDFTGPALDELEAMGEIEVVYHGSGPDKYPYIQRPSKSPSAEAVEDISAKTTTWQRFLREPACGSYFGELVNFVALARAITELKDTGIKTYSILPQGNYPHQLKDKGQIDVFIQLHGENFPLDVYNGTHYLRNEDHKPARAREIHAKGHANPCLASRLAHQAVKFEYSRMDGLVLDHGRIFGLRDDTTQEWQDLTRFFNLHRAIEWLPKIKVGAYDLDGMSYFENSSRKKDGMPVLDEYAFAAAADQIPSFTLEGARGFVRLLYVNAEYRLARDNKEARAIAIATQRGFHKLLRSDDGMQLDEMIDYGWRSFIGSYRNVASFYRKEETRYMQLLHERARELHARKILKIHGSKVTVPNSRHPHIDLAYRRPRRTATTEEDEDPES